MSDEANENTGGRWASMLQPVNLAVLLITTALALAALFGGIASPDDGVPWTLLLIAAPGVFTVWFTVRTAAARGIEPGERRLRMLFGGLAAPVMVAAPVGVVLLVSMLFPAVREGIARASLDVDSHFNGLTNPIAQVIVTTLLVLLGGVLAAAAALMIVVLPVMALTRPEEVAEGSEIENAQAKHRVLISRLLYIGLVPLVIGIALWVFSGSHPIADFPDDFGYVVQSFASGSTPHSSTLCFVGGVLLVVIGGLAVVGGIVLQLFSAAGEQDGRPAR